LIHRKIDRATAAAREKYMGRVWEKYMVSDPIPDGQRNNTLFRIACSMRAQAASMEHIMATLNAVNEKRCQPPLDVREVERIAQSAGRYPEGTPEAQEGTNRKFYALTDMGNAERLVDRHGTDLRFCAKLGGWFVWDGTRWLLDETGEVIRRAKETVRRIRMEAKQIQALSEEQMNYKKELEKHARASESRHRISNMIELAKSELGIPLQVDQLDAQPWLLNVKNGTINLETGQLQEHRREDLISKLAPVEYNPDAQCPRWLAFLEQIMGGDTELIEFLQKAVGYTLTGDTREQVMFFLYGSGANGKSTFLDIIQEMMGDYAQQVPASLLMAKPSDGVPNDVARIRGARFVSTVETEDGRRMAESLVKQLTGGDKIVARFLRQEFFEFKPEAKVFLASNHKPIITGTDYAIWRRIHLIPFEVTIPPEKRNKQLPAKLRAEMPGILRWAVEGCLKWQREGLKPPAKVLAATEEYRTEMDALGQFIEECFVLSWDAKTAIPALYKAYTDWCEENGERPMKQRMLAKRLKDRGFQQEKTTGGKRVWIGIGLLDSVSDIDSGKSGIEKGINQKIKNEKNMSYAKNDATYATNATPATSWLEAAVTLEEEEGEL
jgi:putative DNA primase/helicase